MSTPSRYSWLRYVAVVLVTVLSLGMVTLGSTPAQARVFVSVGVPLPGVGYYAPAPYYPYAYPAYWYYPGRVFIGGAFGPDYYYYHHYYRHWR